MATEIRFRRRATGQTAGAPSGLKTAEPAYNMTDGKFYIGYGDTGAGIATSIRAFGKDDFIVNIPAGGTSGQSLVKNSAVDGDVTWVTVASGGAYTASENGIELVGSVFSLNYTEIATGISLSTYALTTALTSGLAGKANTAHTHVAADITSGTFTTALIPALDASKITTGVFDVARIPVLAGNGSIVASSNIASLTAPQQTAIEAGTIVTTTDGRRWVYNTGSKTAEASYIELADITPEWSVIANKPAFATVATSGSYLDLSSRPTFATVATSGAYADLTGKPTLGTMSSQAASAVAITGGTIDGVVLDGGTF